MRTLTLAVVALITAAPVGAMQAQPAPAKPAAQAPAPAAKPAAPAPAPATPGAQAPAPAKPAAAAPAPAVKPNASGQPAAAPVEAAAPPPPPVTAQAGESYTYEPANRRDPFRNLLGNDPTKTGGYRPPGIQGMSVNEISVRGVIEKLDGGYVAMIQGPDNKTYSIHTGDRFADGLVRAVNAEGLVIVQEVNDPLSLVKQREVSKKLRSLEAKE